MKTIAVTLNCYKNQFNEKNPFDWLTQELKSQWKDQTTLPDLVAIGLQEFLPFNKAFIFGDFKYEESFREQLHNALEGGFSSTFKENSSSPRLSFLTFKGRRFSFVKNIRHVGNAIYLFTSGGLDIIDMNACYMGSGWFWMGNKGAVALKLTIEDKSEEKATPWTLCFISCHFDSHQTDLYYRNIQFQDIPTRMLFTEMNETGNDVYYSSVSDQDVVILMGDLNYRVYTKNKTSSELLGLYQTSQFSELFQYDQLSHQLSKSSNQFASKFTEAEITFPPTYKYIQGSSALNETRIPSWCDRILLKSSLFAFDVEKYFSVVSCKLSDHKPVVAFINFTRTSETTSRGIAEEKYRNIKMDSYYFAKQRIGNLADFAAGLLVIMWTNSFKIPVIIASIVAYSISGSIKNKLW